MKVSTPLAQIPNPNPVDFFNGPAARAYDERNGKLAPVSENMHFLIRLILKDLPQRAHILCVGAGTGAEILSLAKAFPKWTFAGVDPSAAMLGVCAERLKGAGVSERCELIHGYAEDAPVGEKFDAALSILVAHFVQRADRLAFFESMTSRLKKNGVLINSEISCDLNSGEFPLLLREWEKIQTLMGATKESLANLPRLLRENLSILPPHETENLLRKSGIHTPVRFFQTFAILGWYGRKEI